MAKQTGMLGEGPPSHQTNVLYLPKNTQARKIIRAKVTKEGVECVFAEPQFKSKLVDTVVEGTSARTGVIDPLGAKLGAGPDLYFQLIQAMSKSFEDCLHLR